MAHGLKTSYKDFIDDYWRTVIEINYESYKENNDLHFKIETSSSTPNLKHFFNSQSFPHSYKGLADISKYYAKNYHYTLENPLRLKFTNSFLKQISDNTFHTWVDIENEYFNYLASFVNQERKAYYMYGSIEKLNIDFKYIQDKLEDYLCEITTHSERTKIKRINQLIYAPFILKDLVSDAQIKIVKDEHKKIDKYLNKDSNPDFDSISEKTIPWADERENDFIYGDFDLRKYLLDEKISTKYFDLLPSNVLFLNFNYTNLEKLYSKHKTIHTEINHIHGELKNEHNPIIFGYGDELEESYQALENKQDNEFLKNIKSIQYLETDNYKRMLEFIESDDYQIIILGHSCGNSDRTLLNTLFEHENCVSIKPYYYRYQEEGSNIIKDNYSDIVRNISRNFKDKKSMRDKVVNKKYCDWFSEDI